MKKRSEPNVRDLPNPRLPRTKIPSIEIIVRTPNGDSIGFIGHLNRSGLTEAQRILAALQESSHA